MADDPNPRVSSYFAGCLASPSWLPVHRDRSRFHLLDREARERGRNWRNLLKRLLLKEGRTFYTSKPLTFGYDAVSYAKNFDDGSGKSFDDAGHCWNAKN